MNCVAMALDADTAADQLATTALAHAVAAGHRKGKAGALAGFEDGFIVPAGEASNAVDDDGVHWSARIRNDRRRACRRPAPHPPGVVQTSRWLPRQTGS